MRNSLGAVPVSPHFSSLIYVSKHILPCNKYSLFFSCIWLLISKNVISPKNWKIEFSCFSLVKKMLARKKHFDVHCRGNCSVHFASIDWRGPTYEKKSMDSCLFSGWLGIFRFEILLRKYFYLCWTLTGRSNKYFSNQGKKLG